MRNTASKDKKVRLERIVHTPTVQQLIYSGYGHEVTLTHVKATGAGNGKNQGWTVEGLGTETHKKAHAIALAAELLQLKSAS